MFNYRSLSICLKLVSEFKNKNKVFLKGTLSQQFRLSPFYSLSVSAAQLVARRFSCRISLPRHRTDLPIRPSVLTQITSLCQRSCEKSSLCILPSPFQSFALNNLFCQGFLLPTLQKKQIMTFACAHKSVFLTVGWFFSKKKIFLIYRPSSAALLVGRWLLLLGGWHFLDWSSVVWWILGFESAFR